MSVCRYRRASTCCIVASTRLISWPTALLKTCEVFILEPLLRRPQFHHGFPVRGTMHFARLLEMQGAKKPFEAGNATSVAGSSKHPSRALRGLGKTSQRPRTIHEFRLLDSHGMQHRHQQIGARRTVPFERQMRAMLRPEFAPPASTSGRFSLLCELPSPMPEPKSTIVWSSRFPPASSAFSELSQEAGELAADGSDRSPRPSPAFRHLRHDERSGVMVFAVGAEAACFAAPLERDDARRVGLERQTAEVEHAHRATADRRAESGWR